MTTQCTTTYKKSETGVPSTRSPDVRDEYAFVVAAKSGDSAAFEFLCKQSANMAFRVARRMLRNKEDAEDVLQEALKQAFIHLKSFNGHSRFSTWLSRIAINAALMKLRTKQHLWDVSLDEPTETERSSALLDVEDPGLNPEQLYVQEERQRILSTAMNELTPGTRKVIQLRDLDQRSSEETALIMGMSVSAVKTRVFHGRRQLRESLTQIAEPAWHSARNTARRMDDTTYISLVQTTCDTCD
jgi:RNA polymerase sigma-70 factor (ECF subfamily)